MLAMSKPQYLTDEAHTALNKLIWSYFHDAKIIIHIAEQLKTWINFFIWRNSICINDCLESSGKFVDTVVSRQHFGNYRMQ